MSPRNRYSIEFAPEAFDHIGTIERKYYGLIERSISQQLTNTPERETRNRKPLEQLAPLGATWELRFGPNNRFRVFYEVDTVALSVNVLGIGVKDGNRLLIGGVEFSL